MNVSASNRPWDTVPESEPEDEAAPCVYRELQELLVSCLGGHGCGAAGKEGELGKGVSNRE